MKYILGANYWGKDFATHMWRNYDGEKIREELKVLKEHGIKCLRVFPNWEDFQPVDKAYSWRAQARESFNVKTGNPVPLYGDGVDPVMIDRFRDFCKACEELNIDLVVAIVTGWMSGKLYCPPILKGKNLISDPEALIWMRRFIHRFVRELKNEKSIIMWGLGNECNCLGWSKNDYESYVWTSTVVDAIRSEDRSRPISSDMHALTSTASAQGGEWSLETQGELCDVLSPHPYPSPTVGGDVEPYTRLRMTMLPTAQSLYYSGITHKPAYIQEHGTFSDTIGNKEMAGADLRMQVLSSLANGVIGVQWWCAWEQNHLDYSPYAWSMIEQELGLFDAEGNPKPVAREMKKISPLIDKFPEGLPERQVDGVCVLSRGQKQQNTAISSIILGKQAGIDLSVALCHGDEIPASKLYFLPGLTGWDPLYKKPWETLLARVEQGATLCISYDGGQITGFDKTVGASSLGVIANTRHSFELDGQKVDYSGKEILLAPTTAEVVLKNEQGNPVMLKNQYGKGTIYFINFAPERLTFDTADGYNILPYYKLYKMVAKEIIDAHIVTSDTADIGITHNPINEHETFVTVLNYSDKDLKNDMQIKQGWHVAEIVYGNLDVLPFCDGTIFKLVKD